MTGGLLPCGLYVGHTEERKYLTTLQEYHITAPLDNTVLLQAEERRKVAEVPTRRTR